MSKSDGVDFNTGNASAVDCKKEMGYNGKIFVMPPFVVRCIFRQGNGGGFADYRNYGKSEVIIWLRRRIF